MGNEKIKSDLRDISLLIVEDGEDIISIMDRTFKMLVNDIQLATDGDMAFEKYKARKPDVIMTDVRMPHCNGTNLIKNIREIDKDTPIIVISAYPQDLKDEEREMVNAVFEKPIDFIKLLKALDECVNITKNS